MGIDTGLAISIPGREDYLLRHLVLDVNGTLATDGRLLDGVSVRLRRLGELMQVHLLTADTHGRQREIDMVLGLKAHRLGSGAEDEQKKRYVRALEGHSVAAGNGANDAGMLRAADIGLAVLGEEGLSVAALTASDLVTQDITGALDLLLLPDRLRATLRR